MTGSPKQPVGDSGAVGVIALLLMCVEMNNEIVPHYLWLSCIAMWCMGDKTGQIYPAGFHSLKCMYCIDVIMIKMK